MAPRHSKLRREPKTAASDGNPWANTPVDVVERIFTFLPIRTAARYAVVSKNFVESWWSSRELDFDRHFLRKLRREGIDFPTTVSRAIGAHTGDEIRHLKLYYDLAYAAGGHVPFEEIESWIRTSSQKGLRRLDLDFREAPIPYLIGRDLLAIETLEELKLRNCFIQGPLRLESGLRNLTTLVLRRVLLRDGVVERLLDRCEALETLDIGMCGGCDDMMLVPGFSEEGIHYLYGESTPRRLRTVKLGGLCREVSAVCVSVDTVRTLFYEGEMKKLKFIYHNAPAKIEEAMLYLRPNIDCHYPSLCAAAQVMVDAYFGNVSVLTTTNPFLEILGHGLGGHVVPGLNTNFPNLKEFQLFIKKPNYCNLFHIASFLANSPLLEKLIIDLSDFSWEPEIGAKMEKFSEISFDKLRLIRLSCFKFKESEIEMLEFFMKKAPALETIALIHPRKRNQMLLDQEKVEEFRSLFETWKRSPSTEISVSVWWKDNTEAPKHFKSWYT